MRKPTRSKSAAPVAMLPAKLISVDDIWWLLRLPLMVLIAWCTPPATWTAYAAWSARRRAARKPKPRAAFADKIARTLSTWQIASSPEQIAQDLDMLRLENTLQLLRHYRPGRWEPPLTVVGREHIDAGLARGSGVILWVADFAFHGLILKLALHRLGYAVSHFYGARHGFSTTRFGMRFLNPIRTGIEARFLRERVVMSDKALPTPRRVVSAMRVLWKRLEENGVVSISALASDWGPEKKPLFDGVVRLPAGPPGLAYKSGAPLLPVFTVRNAVGTYEVIVEPSLALHDIPSRREAVDVGVAGYRDLLEAYVARYPGQWTGWRYVIAPAAADDGDA